MEFRSQPLSKSSAFPRRLAISLILCALVAATVLGRVFWLSVIRGEEFASRASANLQSLQRIEAPRGNIRDRKGRPVASNRRAYALSYTRRSRSEAEVHETLRVVGELMELDLLEKKEVIMSTRPSWTQHSLARRLTQKQIIPILERLHEFPGLGVSEDFRREYQGGPALANVVGFMGKITPEETEKFSRPLYLPDAWVGRSGLERRYEDELVGKRGLRRLVRDARGAAIEDPSIVEQAHPGDDLILTVDAELQQTAHELLGETKGSVVLMNALTGDVLVLASTPSFDPMAPWKQELDGKPVSFINRASQGAYPPGSTFKLVTASAAMRGRWTPETPVFCSGAFRWPGWNRPFHCDHRSGHGTLQMEEAIQRSCNVYFYKAGHDLGGSALVAEAKSFGFGTKTGIDLPGERSGSLSSDGTPPAGGEILNFSIGQGALLATPLQVARSYATLANGGRLIRPRLVSAIDRGDGSGRRTLPVLEEPGVQLSSASRTALIHGFEAAVNEYGGTAWKAEFPKHWRMCGKTGTAENGRNGVDAWFAGFFPADAPTHVVVAHIEDADGHGGDVAAPIVREVLKKFLEPESVEAVAMSSSELMND